MHISFQTLDGNVESKIHVKILLKIISPSKNKNPYQETFLKNSIMDFLDKTNSEWARNILENFDDYIEKFLIVKPKAIKIEEIFNKDSVAA